MIEQITENSQAPQLEPPTQQSKATNKLIAAWPLLLNLLLLLGVVGLFVGLAYIAEGSGFRPPYTLDDTYIHMAIAKNIAQHGVWGVNPYEFSSSASSLLWPLLLAGIYWLTKANQYVPLILNLVFACLELGVVYFILCHHDRFQKTPALYKFLVLLAVLFLAPLPTLVLDGMEHNLHILLITIFVAISVQLIVAESFSFKSRLVWLWLAVALLATMARYETAFAALVVGLLMLIRGRWLATMAVGIAAALPIAVYGLISTALGALWLPNSIVLKSHPFDFSLATIPKFFGYIDFGGKDQVPSLTAPHLLVLAVSALLLFIVRAWRQKPFWEIGQVWLVIFLATTFLHLQGGGISWFYRYEDYVVVLGICAIALAGAEFWPQRWQLKSQFSTQLLPRTLALLILFFVLCLPLTDRAIRAIALTPAAVANVYEQQYQVGLFVNRYYNNTAIAANDVGAISYLSNAPVVDLSGLTTLAITKLVKANDYDQRKVEAIIEAANVKVAVTLDGYSPPPGWIAVARWTVPNPVSIATPTIWFYALNKAEAVRLRQNLQQFGYSLPKDVKQELLP